jgi:hypothetical protein
MLLPPEASLTYFRSDIPVGQAGAWVVEKVVLPERDYDPTVDPRPDCFKFRPGVYTCLRRGSTQFMTDLYDEWWTQRSAIQQALARGGDVLITGLGLALVAEAILREPHSRVNRVTIIEKSADVIRLVAPYLEARHPGKVEVIEADAFVWKPPLERRFTVGWHDIWPDPHPAQVLQEVDQLREHHRQWCEWQGFWPIDYLEASAVKDVVARS